MARQLISNWTDYQTALDRLLAMAGEKIQIYDEDLAHLQLESTFRAEQLKRVLHIGQKDCLQIAVRNGASIRQHHPSLLGLLSTYSHLSAALQTPPHLAHLRDAMVIADRRYALIRFEREIPRSKLLIDEPEEIRSYLTRFQEIWSEGGESLTATTLGL